MLNTPDIFRLTKDFTLGASDPKLSSQLAFPCYGVFVQNTTTQWLYLPSVGFFVPPNGVGSIPLDGSQTAQAYFAAPGGTVQPVSVAGQKATLYFVGWPVTFSVTVSPIQIAAVSQLEKFTKATIPAPGNAGRLILLTDYDRGVWKDTGAAFVSLEREEFNIKQFGCIADSGVTDNGPNLRACITAAMAAPGGARIIVPRGDGYYGFTGGLSVNGAVGLSIVGAGGVSNGGPVPSTLRATDAPARVLDARNTEGFVIEDVSTVCANAAFTGTVIDLGSANHFTVYRDQVLHTAQGIFLDLTNAIIGAVEDCSFNGSAITGASTGILLGGANITTIRLRDNNFKCAGNFSPIRSTVTGEIDGLVIDGITLDGIGNATPAVALIDLSAAVLVRGLEIEGLWSGDMGAGSTGSIVHTGVVRGCHISGSFIAGSGNAGAQTGITVGAASDGVEIEGNDIFSLLVGIAWGANPLHADGRANRNAAATPQTGAPMFSQNVTLVGDVNLTPINTFVDVLSLAQLPPGTWRIIARALALPNGAGGIISCKLWDGAAAAIAADEFNSQLNGQTNSLIMEVIVTIAAATTFKISAAASLNNSTIKANGLQQAMAALTSISAERIGV